MARNSRSRGAPGPFLHAALALLLVTLSWSCSDPPPNRLRIGILQWPPYEMAFLAESLGYLDDRQIELVDYSSPAVLIRDYRNGSVDAATVTIHYALALAARDPDQRIVLAIDESLGGDTIVARPPISSIEELRGKRVGMEVSSLGAYVLCRALEIHGLEHEDVEVVPVDQEQQEQLFAGGTIDAVTTYEPMRTRLLQRGAVELFSTADLPGEVIDVLLTRDALPAEHSATLRAFCQAWFRAIEHYHQFPEDTAARVAAREHIPEDDFLRAMRETQRLIGLEENRAWLSGAEPELRRTLQRVQEYGLRRGLVRTRCDLDLLLDPSHLP